MAEISDLKSEMEKGWQVTTLLEERLGRHVSAGGGDWESGRARSNEAPAMKFTYTSGSRALEGYTIKRGVGHGGFGEVYYAVSDGGKEVALKLVMRNLDVELRGVAQCMNLKHPNLVTLYDLRTNDVGEHFVVMEYVSGKSLADLLDDQPNGFALDEVNRWLKGICGGIGYLHDKGIVHRDLKPGNVFIEDGVVKIGDYGLSKFITASRRSGQTESVGTVHYMAPEISRGKYDREIDVYATGIMLYEMITGHVPFEGESVGEILMKHLTAQPDVSKLPPPYDQVAARALEKDPTARFRTMEQLSGSLNGRLIESETPSKLRDTVRYVPLSPEAVLGAAGATAGATGPTVLAAAPAEPTFATATDWFSHIRAKTIAWYHRPWGSKDYFLAALSLLAIGSAGTILVAGMAPLLVPALVTIGIVLLVMKATKKKDPQVGKAAPVAPPIVLGPINSATIPTPPSPIFVAAPPVAPNPVVLARPVTLTTPIRMASTRPVAPREPLPKPARMRLAEASSSMLLTTVLSVIASALAAGLMGLSKPAECALLAATCLAGCWAVVIPAKIWEGQHGDAMIRRLIMAALGMGVGMSCSYLDWMLQVGWLNDPKNTAMFLESLEWIPLGVKDASFFGLVFLMPRWWTLADSRRGLKFNPWMVIVPCFWAWLITLMWRQSFETPYFWGVIVTGLIAALVQLATPWEDPATRRRVIV